MTIEFKASRGLYRTCARVFVGLLIGYYSYAILGSCRASSLNYFVAPNGNDSWSGLLESPSKSKTDGPFLTIERAQRAARADNHAHTVTVEIRAGQYALSSPLIFTPQDSGTSEHPVTYCAYKNEHAVISGGVPIKGWKINPSGQWQTQLPDVKSGTWNFEQLFVNGQRRYRPRLPENGYFSISATAAPSPMAAGHGYDRFQYQPGDIDPSWQNRNDIEVLVFHRWSMGRMLIAQIDGAQHIVQFTGPTPNTDAWASLPAGNRYQVENVKEALHSPGQWYLDRPSGVLTYIPVHGESIADADVVAPKLTQLLFIAGDQAAHSWVQYLTFRGIGFEHTNYVTPPMGHDFGQAEVDVRGVIEVSAARDCSFDSCDFAHTGGYGITLAIGCKHVKITRTHFSDLGAGGIMIGTSDRPKDPELETSDNTVSDCDIYAGGRLHPGAVSIWIGQSYSNTVRNCAIHDLYYSGISLGWTWGYGDSLCHGNVISDNDIYDLGQGVLSDMGGIYSLGTREGTLEDHNRIHNVQAAVYGGWGIYFDEGTSDTTATRNLVYDTSAAGFNQHYGARNIVTNNIFAFGREAQLMRTLTENHLSFTLEHNIVLSNGAPVLGTNWAGDQFTLDFNDYWTLGKSRLTMDKNSFDDWRKSGHDTHSIVANPGFENPSAGDFHLENSNVVDRIGFKVFDVDHFGPVQKFIDPALPSAFPSAVTPSDAVQH